MVQSSKSEGSTYTFRRLTRVDASQLSRLITKYGRELSGKSTKVNSETWTQGLFEKDFILLYGIFSHEILVGFAIVFELPEAVFQTTSAQLDDLFVLPEHRGKRLAADLLKRVVEDGKAAGWSHLRWMVPESDVSAIRLYQRIATSAPWKNFVIRLDAAASL